jgi:transcriptional regulator with XRE-family HTH domain
MKDPAFKSEYEALDPEFNLLEKMLKARVTAGLSQADVAQKMHTTTSVVGRLETAGGKHQHSPSLRTLERYAAALGYTLNIDFIPRQNLPYRTPQTR